MSDAPLSPLDILAAADQAYLALMSAENSVAQAKRLLTEAQEAFTQVCAQGESISMNPNRIKKAAIERIEFLVSNGQMPDLEAKTATKPKPKPKAAPKAKGKAVAETPVRKPRRSKDAQAATPGEEETAVAEASPYPEPEIPSPEAEAPQAAHGAETEAHQAE